MYSSDENRYRKIKYRRCGKSGLKLPEISLGFWHNFGGVDKYETGCETVLSAFDSGITHFDLANNYGPPPGSAEITFGRILKENLMPYRDEIIISTKAGFGMWPGPYGDRGSRKYLFASLDASLKRMGLDYVDIFYHHRPDPNTPLEETMKALADIVHTGKALYAGISNYNAEQSADAIAMLRSFGYLLNILNALDLFRRFQFRRPGVQEPGPGLMGGADLEIRRPVKEIYGKGQGVPGGEGIPADLQKQIRRRSADRKQVRLLFA